MSDKPTGGRVLIVSGAAQGIGRCIARFMARDGPSVVLAEIKHERARAVAGSPQERGLDARDTFVRRSEDT